MAIAKKRKKFFNVDMPIIGKQTQLQAFEIKELNNSYITYDLTRMLKGKNMILQLKVKSDKEMATSVTRQIKLTSSYLIKMVRKGTDYVEDSFSADCKNARLKIKPFLIARKKVSRKVKKALREMAKEELIKYIKLKDSETIFEELIKNRLQKELSLKLKKIYPLSLCEIRILKVENEFEENLEKETEGKLIVNV